MKKETLLNQLTKLEGLQHIDETPRIIDEIASLRSRLENDVFTVAVVGEFSAGKSTFINAMLKQDLLKHAAQEVTACITYLVNIPKHEKQTCAVMFQDGTSQILDSFSDLTDFSTTLSAKFDVSDQIERVEIKMPFWKEGSKLILVDTPGLNGVADKHRELTIEEIKNAHACIYLLHLRSLSATDLDFIHYLTRYQTHFLFVINFIDELHSEEGETREQKIAETREILEDKVFRKAGNGYHFEVCGVSSLKALAAFDTNIKRLYATDTSDLTEEQRPLLYKESGFEDFYQKAEDFLSMDKYQALKCDVVQAALRHLVEQLKEDAERNLSNIKELQENSREIQRRKLLEQRRDRFKANKSRKQQSLLDFIDSEHSTIRKLLEKSLKQQIQELNDLIFELVKKVENYDDLKQKIDSGFFNIKITEGIFDIDHEQDEKAISCLQNLLDNALLRVRESCDWNEGTTKKVHDVNFSGSNTEENTIEVDREKQEVMNLRSQIRQKEDEKNSTELASRRARQERSEKEESERKLEQEASRIEQEKASLGSEPDVKTLCKTEITLEDRKGFFGKIGQFFMGKRRVESQVSYSDTSEREDWEKQMARIENKRVSTEDSRSRVREEIYKLNNEISNNEEQIKRIEDRKRLLETQLKDKEERQQQWEKDARNELLRKRKSSILQTIKEYLLGADETNTSNSILESRKRNLEEMLDTNIEIIKKDVKKDFDSSYDKQLKLLSSFIEGKESEAQKPLEKWQIALDYYERLLLD